MELSIEKFIAQINPANIKSVTEKIEVAETRFEPRYFDEHHLHPTDDEHVMFHLGWITKTVAVGDFSIKYRIDFRCEADDNDAIEFFASEEDCRWEITSLTHNDEEVHIYNSKIGDPDDELDADEIGDEYLPEFFKKIHWEQI